MSETVHDQTFLYDILIMLEVNKCTNNVVLQRIVAQVPLLFVAVLIPVVRISVCLCHRV